MTALLTDVRSYLLKVPLCLFLCYLTFKYQCKNIYNIQHTAITFATAHWFFFQAAFTVENVATDFPGRIVTAARTSTVPSRVLITLVIGT